jgi:hypothetical protein
MGTGSYIGAHTKVFISDGGTRWEVPDAAANEPDGSRKKRWDEEVAGASDGGPSGITKEMRSFLSMCAVAFHRDLLTESNPKSPPALHKQIKLAGGNKNWIARDPVRLRLFADFYKKGISKPSHTSSGR